MIISLQEFSYTFKIWLSGILLTPALYYLLLTLALGCHLPSSFGTLIYSYILPYTLLVSVWIAMSIFCVILLTGGRDKKSIKLILSATAIALSFSGFILIHHINALRSYNSNYLLSVAYATSNLALIWLYDLKSVTSRPVLPVSQIIKHAVIYGLTVWLFSLLLSVPATILGLFLSKSYYNSLVKTALDIVERYYIQLTQSIAFFITVALSCMVTLSLGLFKGKGRTIIFLFTFPLSFPVYFYFLIFSGEIINNSAFDIATLIIPSTLVCALCIRLIVIDPRSENVKS